MEEEAVSRILINQSEILSSISLLEKNQDFESEKLILLIDELKNEFKVFKWFKVFDLLNAILKFFKKVSELKISTSLIQSELTELKEFFLEFTKIKPNQTEVEFYNHNPLRLKYQLYDFKKLSEQNFKKETIGDKIAEDPKIVEMVTSEITEILDGLENEFVELEKNPSDEEQIAKIFRAVHTIKGNSATIGLTDMNSLSHEFESLLSKLRDKSLIVSDLMIDISYKSLDLLKNLLRYKGQISKERKSEISDMIYLIQVCIRGEASSTTSKEIKLESTTTQITQQDKYVRVAMDKLDSIMNWSGELHLTLIQKKEIFKQFSNLNLEFKNIVDKINDSTNKMNGTNLDYSLYVSQLKDRYFQIASDLEDKLNLTSQISSEIRNGLISTRMVSLNSLWGRFPRVVRDLAKFLEKEVNLEMKNGELEIDKKILEEISDPMMHLVRNAVDHGIENKTLRKQKGKSETGSLTISANKSGSEIHIQVMDDGGGFDLEKIKTKAIAKGLKKQEDLENLKESEIIQLIFLPGFSTKEVVTDVSGRGVGLDVVLQNAKNLKGTVSASRNTMGGSTFTIIIPVSLSMENVLYVQSGGDKYAIPLTHIRATEKIELNSIEKMGEDQFIQRLGNYFLVKSLSSILHPGTKIAETNSEKLNVLIMKNSLIAFTVDNILKKEEIVIKPLPKEISSLNYFSGTTIDQNGNAVLILNLSKFNGI